METIDLFNFMAELWEEEHPTLDLSDNHPVQPDDDDELIEPF